LKVFHIIESEELKDTASQKEKTILILQRAERLSSQEYSMILVFCGKNTTDVIFV